MTTCKHACIHVKTTARAASFVYIVNKLKYIITAIFVGILYTVSKQT